MSYRYRLPIPKEVLVLNPGIYTHEARAIIMAVLKAKSAVLKHSDTFRLSLTGIGVMRSRANKKPKGLEKIRERDRERKRKQSAANKLLKGK